MFYSLYSRVVVGEACMAVENFQSSQSRRVVSRGRRGLVVSYQKTRLSHLLA